MPYAQKFRLPQVTDSCWSNCCRQCTRHMAESFGFSMIKWRPCLIWCKATCAQNRTIGRSFCLSSWHFCSPLAVLHIHHGAHLGAMCMTSGLCSRIICMAFCWPDLLFRSKPSAWPRWESNGMKKTTFLKNKHMKKQAWMSKWISHGVGEWKRSEVMLTILMIYTTAPPAATAIMNNITITTD